MNLFDKLMVAKQFSFSEGRIDLMGNRVVISNATLFVEYSARINDSAEKVVELYESAKISFREGMAKGIGKAYSFSFNDFFKWLTDIAMLAGWGNLKWDDLNEEKKSGRIIVNNSPVAEKLTGRVSLPVDHVIRGFIAGGASGSLNTNIDALEEECMALGAPACSFIFKPAGEFDRSQAEVARQLGKTVSTE